MLSLEIISSGQAKQDKQTNKQGKIFILQNNYAQAKTQTEKMVIMREWMELEEFDDNTIQCLAPKTPDELNAERKLVLINNEDMIGAKIDDPMEDHYTFIKIFNTADHNKVKTEAIRRRYEAILQSGQLQEQYNQQQEGSQ